MFIAESSVQISLPPWKRNNGVESASEAKQRSLDVSSVVAVV